MARRVSGDASNGASSSCPTPSGQASPGSGQAPTGGVKRSRYGEYNYLLGRVDSWSMLDLDDLMLEIETDRGLSADERKELLARVYEILWRRAQKEMDPQDNVRNTAH